MRKKIVISIIFIFIVILIIFIKKEYKNEHVVQEEKNIPVQNEKVNIEVKKLEKQYPRVEVIKKYKGYTVCAKLEIPTINLETYILKNYSEKALNTSPTKFWGANPNEIGNFCVAGHNFINKNMFRNLKKLNINDKIIVSDNNIGIIEYKIFSIETVTPDNTDCLSQETNGFREITLITCTNNSKKRIIVKAREI